MNERFGEWVKQRRKALDLTQNELAERVDYSSETIKKIEANQRFPSKELAATLMQSLQIEPQDHGRFLSLARNKEWQPTRQPTFPQPLTPIIDRTDELKVVTQLILHPTSRLLTLTGPGGVGKTRLTYQVAQTVLPHFADGVRFIALESVTQPGLFETAVAHALKLFVPLETEINEKILDYLWNKQMLLVLDNFEQILPAAVQVAAWLEAVPQLTVLVTSRTRLNLLGEQEYVVPPMGLPDLSHLPQAGALAASSPAIDLFVQRVQAIRPKFELNAENGRSVAEICAFLDGIPLAIELAATRCKLLDPPELLARLRDASALNLLVGGAQNLPSRQQTIRQTIDWSFHLLGQAEKQLFARLCVFVDGATLTAVETICGTNNQPTFESLSVLIDQNLIWRDSQSRLQMLGVLREYALEQLSMSGELDRYQQKHAAYYADFVEKTVPLLHTRELPHALQLLKAEHPNLRAALAWAIATPGQAEMGLRMTAHLWQFWLIHGDAQEGCGWIAQLVAQVGPELSTLTLAQSFNGMGVLLASCSLPCRPQFEQALIQFRQLEDICGEAGALSNLAESVAPIDRQEAEALLDESLRLFRSQECVGVIMQANYAWALKNSAEIAIQNKQFGQAQAGLDEAIGIFDRLGDERGLAWTMFCQGRLLNEQGDASEAQRIFEQSLGMFQALDDVVMPSWMHHTAAWGAFHLGNLNDARAHFWASLRIFQQVDDMWGTAVCMLGFAHVYLAEGDATQAVFVLGAAMALFKQTPRRPTQADQNWLAPLLAALQSEMDSDSYQRTFQSGTDSYLECIDLLFNSL